MKTRGGFMAALFVAIAMPSIVLAHAHLRHADPPMGGTVHTPPRQVEIAFSEAIEPRFSSISVVDASGARVDRNDAHTHADDPKRLVVSLGPVAPGMFTVAWRVTAVDTHKTEGSFTFHLVEP